MDQHARKAPARQALLDVQRLFDASPNPYLVLDRDLNIATANKAYLASVKRELHDLVGRWAWEAFPTDPETERQAIAPFERVIATKQPMGERLLRKLQLQASRRTLGRRDLLQLARGSDRHRKLAAALQHEATALIPGRFRSPDQDLL